MDITAAIAHLKAGDWEAAHRIVQEDESTLGAWAHGIVHLLEGDRANAGYWYRRAGRALPGEGDVSREGHAREGLSREGLSRKGIAREIEALSAVVDAT